jgi:molecular chaperone GrpE|tara:strand:+ start:48 stop:731 length:684 start_codon:yes stop_codon:yes gene_type:complete
MSNKYQKVKDNEKKADIITDKDETDLDKNQRNISKSKEEINQNKNKENLEESEQNKKKLEEKNQEQDQSIIYEEEISKLREEKLRLLAEMENIRKRFEREKSDSIRYGSTNLARDILSPHDNLARALENIPDNKNLSDPLNNFIDGLKMVQKEFTTILEKHGVKKIDALNKKFDHNLHLAMLEIETDKKENGIVVQEIQSGYTMHDRLLRPASVGVSKKSKKNKDIK